ncbi:hypothetical protein J5X84_24400 [Streptosporangiaceae bacterium NEAU-GS5]|nr:hypothetical protein [Streptosporangiaceae bacterium NEAU-GS5]
MSFFIEISGIAGAYAMADEARFTTSDGQRMIMRTHMALALATTENAAAGILADAGFAPTEPRPPAYEERGSLHIAPELARDQQWVNGLVTGLGGAPDPSLCYLLSWLVGTNNLDRWFLTRGADTDQVCGAVTAALGLPASICDTRVRWAGESLRVSADEAAALTRELKAEGRLFGWNKYDDGTVSILPEDPDSPRLRTI